MLGIERHVFDEPNLVAGIARPPREVDDFIVIGPCDHDGVDLDGGEPGRLGRRESGEDSIERVCRVISANRWRRAVARDGRAVDPSAGGAPAIRRRPFVVWNVELGPARRNIGSGSESRGRSAPPVTFAGAQPTRSRAWSVPRGEQLRRGSQAPSAGMQYVHRKLRRSVTEMQVVGDATEGVDHGPSRAGRGASIGR
jgi:hypothetical protein